MYRIGLTKLKKPNARKQQYDNTNTSSWRPVL